MASIELLERLHAAEALLDRIAHALEITARAQRYVESPNPFCTRCGLGQFCPSCGSAIHYQPAPCSNPSCQRPHAERERG